MMHQMLACAIPSSRPSSRLLLLSLAVLLLSTGCESNVSCDEAAAAFCRKADECEFLEVDSLEQCLAFANIRCATNDGCDTNASFVQTAANQCVEALEFETCEEIDGPNSRVPICALVCQ